MSQCKGRYADKECFFKNNKIYFTEKRCVGITNCEEDADLCKNCFAKSTIPFDSKYQKDLYQGKVGEEYFARSHIFGSPWFLKRNNLEEYVISNEEYKAAKEAQRIAIEGNQMPRKKKDEGAETKPKEVKPKQVKAKAEKPKEEKPKEEKPKAEKTKARKKKDVVPVPLPAAPILPPPPPVAVESFEEPIEAFEVVKIPVTLRTIHDKAYWYESSKNKVYEQKKDKGVGKYIGRYDSAEDKIIEFPDSDADV